MGLSYIHHMFVVYFGSTQWLDVVDDHLKLSDYINFNFILFESNIWLFGDDFAPFIYKDSERKELYIYMFCLFQLVLLISTRLFWCVYFFQETVVDLKKVAFSSGTPEAYNLDYHLDKVLTVINTLRNTICTVLNKCWQLRRWFYLCT